MKNDFIHTVTLNGVATTRTSHRTYTHVVVGRRNIAQLRVWAATITKNDRETAAYFAQQANGTGHSALVPETSGQLYRIGKTGQQLAILDGWTTDAAANLTKLINDRVTSLEKQITEGYGTLQVLQWSMTEASARKAVSQFIGPRWMRLDVAVLPVQSRVPATKRQMEAA